jgi:hypothetical protein
MYTEDTASVYDDVNGMIVAVDYQGRSNTMHLHVDDDWDDRMDERAEDLTWMAFTVGAASWCVVVLLFTLACAFFGTLVAAAALIGMVVAEFKLVTPILERMLGHAELWRNRDVYRVAD